MEYSQIEPKNIWKNFALLNAVPRPSKKEERVIAFIKKFGEDLGLDTLVDEVGNVIIRKPASQGMENRQAIVMQSHLDMVCQKNSDVDFDFDTQGIQMYVDGDWVRAKGTTLGADNGLGVATIMTILESNDIPHPAMEALFTIDEETGMTGALGLKGGLLHGDILLNLDTEEDDEIDIGCAGGVDITATASFGTENVKGESLEIQIKGLQGGHSGMDIHKGFGNANKILGRFLFETLKFDVQINSIDGGGLRNAIPREAKAVIKVSNISDVEVVLSNLKTNILEEFASIEKDLIIEINTITSVEKALSIADSKKIIFALNAAHNGVFRMSPDVEGLVEASNNLARIEVKDGAVKILNLTRSSVESTKTEVAQQLISSFESNGLTTELAGGYPGWKPNPGAEIIQIMTDIYEKNFGAKPMVVACHAGLECGIIGTNYPKMEMVSFGPTIKGAHSPDERASISSLQKFWKFLQDILQNIPEKK